MKILAIETSCDETAIAITHMAGERTKPVFSVYAHNIHSQIDIHKDYGGVFPELAKREHARILVPLLVKSLRDADMFEVASKRKTDEKMLNDMKTILKREPELFEQLSAELMKIKMPPIDAIAVTEGPGLEPALWVGINFARSLALLWNKPVIAVNHMEGHLLSPLLVRKDDRTMSIAEFQFPLIGLLVSGGHTEIILARDWNIYEIIGETKDDAVGEAFDKVARILDLPYPGGPEISRISVGGTPKKYPLPRPMIHSTDYHFSFAGLKTAVLYLVKKLGTLDTVQKADIAREFEEACVEVLVTKTLKAAEEYGAQTIVLGGGVSANKRLRDAMKKKIEETLSGVKLFIPEHILSTDNALMIAITASLNNTYTNSTDLRARGNWKIA